MCTIEAISIFSGDKAGDFTAVGEWTDASGVEAGDCGTGEDGTDSGTVTGMDRCAGKSMRGSLDAD